MTLIQILLILVILIFTFFFLLKLKKNIFFKLILLFFSGFGIYFILVPEITTEIGKELGVGRGTDLLLYISIVTAFFTLIGFYTELRKVKAQMTIIIREKAINEAEVLGKNQQNIF